MKQKFPVVPFRGGSGVLAHTAVVFLALTVPVLFFIPKFTEDPGLSFLRWVAAGASIALVFLINSVFFAFFTIDEDGIEYRSLFRKHFYAWHDIASMGFYRIQSGSRNMTGSRIEENKCTGYSRDYIVLSKKEELPETMVLRTASDQSISIIYRPQIVVRIRQHKPQLLEPPALSG